MGTGEYCIMVTLNQDQKNIVAWYVEEIKKVKAVTFRNNEINRHIKFLEGELKLARAGKIPI